MGRKTGLVLEGGGMRGVFTAGVLQYFMEENLYLPYVIGVSAGACSGTSYISRQIERNKIVNIDFIKHPEYISFRNLFRKGELFGMDFIFDRLPNELAPFDFQAFNEAEETFVVGTTDCETGEPVYFDKSSCQEDILTVIRASSSLPLMAPVIEYQGYKLLDGGISDPVPLLKSEKDGNSKNVVILTRNKGYVKKPQSFGWYFRHKYPQFEGLLAAMEKRHAVYNEITAYIEEQESKGNVFVIRPQEVMKVGRIERNPDKLSDLYRQGYQAARNSGEALKAFLG